MHFYFLLSKVTIRQERGKDGERGFFSYLVAMVFPKRDYSRA